MVDLVTVLISVLSAIIVALISSIVAPKATHLYSLKKMKERWKFDWKTKNFKRISDQINEKINFFDTLVKNLQYGKYKNHNFDKDYIKDIVNNEIVFNKFDDGDFYLFDKNPLRWKPYSDFIIQESQIGIMIKEFADKKLDEMELIKISSELTHLHIFKDRLLKEMIQRII